MLTSVVGELYHTQEMSDMRLYRTVDRSKDMSELAFDPRTPPLALFNNIDAVLGTALRR